LDTNVVRALKQPEGCGPSEFSHTLFGLLHCPNDIGVKSPSVFENSPSRRVALRLFEDRGSAEAIEAAGRWIRVRQSLDAVGWRRIEMC